VTLLSSLYRIKLGTVHWKEK